MTELQDEVVTEFRANDGVVTEALGGHFKNVHLLLLHHTGRRTGNRYVTPLLYVEDGGRYVLLGSHGGNQKEPLWVANASEMSEVVIEVGKRTMSATPTVLRVGHEWDRLYAACIAYWPDVLEYQRKTDRKFPLVILSPLT
ncbi:MAG: nitroreductase/quinone reductase family protein [Mycobacterium sp.]